MTSLAVCHLLQPAACCARSRAPLSHALFQVWRKHAGLHLPPTVLACDQLDRLGGNEVAVDVDTRAAVAKLRRDFILGARVRRVLALELRKGSGCGVTGEGFGQRGVPSPSALACGVPLRLSCAGPREGGGGCGRQGRGGSLQVVRDEARGLRCVALGRFASGGGRKWCTWRGDVHDVRACCMHAWSIHAWSIHTWDINTWGIHTWSTHETRALHARLQHACDGGPGGNGDVGLGLGVGVRVVWDHHERCPVICVEQRC
eukprot:355788-Chlamydomonas_euryale.AAC.1